MSWTDYVSGWGPVIVAAGGGIGEPVIHWRQTWPNALFALFEPVPSYFEELERKFADDPRIRLSNEALSDKAGPAILYVSQTPMASSLLPFNTSSPAYYPEWATASVTPIQTTTLDEWAWAQSVDHIGFVELDLQGGELAALRGAKGLLRAGAIDALMVEVFHTDLYQGVPMAGEVYDYMVSLGYRGTGEVIQSGSQFGDVIFVRGQGKHD